MTAARRGPRNRDTTSGERLNMSSISARAMPLAVTTFVTTYERLLHPWVNRADSVLAIEPDVNLKAYADYRPVGSVPHPTMSGMGIWSYSYKA
jgi:hypothetical protein